MELKTSVSDWNGYEKINFQINGKDGFIVCPKEPTPNKAWAWRAEFFGAFDTADRALLAKGRYLAYFGISNMYGCPQAVELMREFYLTVTSVFGLSPRPSIFGFSRGGLYTVNFAEKYPDCVSCIYIDAPVTDIRSWPAARLSASCGDEGCTKECMECYGLKSEEELMSFHGSPNDKAASLAKKGVPVILVAGDADRYVPIKENAEVFIREFMKGSKETPIKVIVKKGCDHHPHSLEDPTEIVDFIEKYDLKV